ncbi:MAG: hypothetical protein IIU63_03165 [Clostridia bacterium]|nr:hypothetical protein [Clostridia bacterium]
MTEQQTPTISDIGEAIEAILFAAGYPVKYDKLAEVLGLSAKVTLVAPGSITRSEGKAVRIIDHRKLHD